MDADLEKLLTDWRIAEIYIDRLRDEEVLSVSTLLLLTEPQIKLIFDKLGPQANFINKLQQLREQKRSGDTSDNATTNSTLTDHGNEFFENESSEKEAESSSSAEKEAGNSQASQKPVSTKEPERRKESVSRKRPSTAAFNVLEIDLESLLLSCLKGKAVISYFEQNQELDEVHRNKLADVMLNHYLKDDHGRKIPSDVEEEMASLIVSYFDGECKETWVSSTAFKRELAVGRGVILKRYYHIRRELRKSGMISKCAKDKETSKVLNFIGENNEATEDQKEKLSWLNYNMQPWPKVLEYWKATREPRLTAHIGGEQSISDYMDTYIALRDKSGYILLDSDFELHFSNANSLYSQWPILAAFVEKKAPPRIVEKIKECLTPEGKKVTTIQALAYLLDCITVAKTKHKTYRPSNEEVSQSLLLIVKTVGDIKNAIANRLQKYELFKLRMSPQAILVGEDEDSIEKSFVRIDNVLYEVENPLKALDITFKSMHVLDTEYHAECKREWLFLERAVYNINVEKGLTKGLNGALANLVRDFQKFKDNSA